MRKAKAEQQTGNPFRDNQVGIFEVEACLLPVAKRLLRTEAMRVVGQDTGTGGQVGKDVPGFLPLETARKRKRFSFESIREDTLEVTTLAL